MPPEHSAAADGSQLVRQSGPPPHFFDADVSLARRAQRTVADLPHFRGTNYPLSFQAYERSVVISGRVPSFYLKQLLQTSLLALDGVSRIINEVEIDYSMFGS
jgi:hypothetical protein